MHLYAGFSPLIAQENVVEVIVDMQQLLGHGLI